MASTRCHVITHLHTLHIMVYLTLIHLSSLGRVNPMHVRDPPPLSTYTTHAIKNLKLLHAAFGAARWHRGKPLVCHIGWRQIM